MKYEIGLIIFSVVLLFMILTGIYFLKCACRLNQKYEEECFRQIPKANQEQYLIDRMDTKQMRRQKNVQTIIDNMANKTMEGFPSPN